MTATLNRSIELLGELVAFESVSADSNLDLIGHIAGYLGEYGIPVLLSHDESATRPTFLRPSGRRWTTASSCPGTRTWCR